MIIQFGDGSLFTIQSPGLGRDKEIQALRALLQEKGIKNFNTAVGYSLKTDFYGRANAKKLAAQAFRAER